MRKLVVAIILLSGIVLTAQRHEGKRKGMRDFNPEQIAELQTKKMTLALDLNTTQQKEIKLIMLDNAEYKKQKMAERKAKKESDTRPTEDEKFAIQNERLDHMIAQKTKMKNILTLEQFEKWEKMQHKRKSGDKDRKTKRK